MTREQIIEQLEFYELSSMKRQQANAQVCRQLLAALDEIEILKRRIKQLETKEQPSASKTPAR